MDTETIAAFKDVDLLSAMENIVAEDDGLAQDDEGFNNSSLTWICCSKSNSTNYSGLTNSSKCWGAVPHNFETKFPKNADSLCYDYRTDYVNSTGINICAQSVTHLAEFDKTIHTLLICSIVLIILTILNYLYNSSMLNIHGKCILGHLIYLTLFFGLQLTELYVKPKGYYFHSYERTWSLCWIIGFLMYFTSISANLWLTAVNVDIFQTFRRKYMEDKEDAKKRFIKYAIVTTGLSFLMSGLVFALDQKLDDTDTLSPGIGCSRCFLPLTQSYSIMIYYYIPIAVLLAFNLVTFSLTNVTICSTQQVSLTLTARRNQGSAFKELFKALGPRFFLFLKLFCVTGTTWTINVTLWLINDHEVSIEDKHPAARFIELFNVSHGFCYFIVFVCKPSALKKLVQKLKSGKHLNREGTLTGVSAFSQRSTLKNPSRVVVVIRKK